MTFSLTKLLRERAPAPAPQCELCALPLEEAHGHVVDTLDRRLLCTCYACGVLFAAPAESAARFKAASRRYAVLPGPLFSDSQWDALGIPIGLAFFYRNSVTGHIATIYPSPAGGTESLLQEECWEMLCEQNPVLRTLLPDVEALLVNRVGGARDYHRVPIDECYKLVGLIRTNWRGLSGGKDVWARIAGFFTDLRSRGVGTRKDA